MFALDNNTRVEQFDKIAKTIGDSYKALIEYGRE